MVEETAVDPQSCRFCTGAQVGTLHTYKHSWLWCGVCGNVARESRVPRLQSLLPQALASRVLPSEVRRLLYVDHAVVEEERLFYDYYADVSGRPVTDTKWSGQIATLRARLAEGGVQLDGAMLLDISGGPGFVVRELGRTAKRAVVTEFSDVAVAGMTQNLGVDAVKFDYNADRLSDVVDGPFDLVTIDYSINFCNDLATFFGDLRELLPGGSVVYVSVVVPTLGCCLRWQFDDYTYNNLYPLETLRSVLSDNGFSIERQFVDAPYHYRAALSLRYRLARAPFDVWYRLRSLSERRLVGSDLAQRSYALLARC